MTLIRVFPRKTSFTPNDLNVRFGAPGIFDEANEVHISVSFTYDLPHAEWLEKQWKHVAATIIGGPGTGQREFDFEPGKYVKKGITITSRGCPNKCWFCNVWKRNGDIRELKIKPGYNVCDDNLLACSDQHIKAVFEMLKKQNQKAIFSGGLEAKILKDWHVQELAALKPKEIFFAYDTPDDLEPLYNAGSMLQQAGFKPTNHNLYCYVLIGYPSDTFSKAESRCFQVLEAGFLPYAMLYKNEKGEEKKEWRRFYREWSNFVITAHKMKKYYSENSLIS